jgi:RNA polymerase sigma-70 factor, ECF subfamily
MTPTEDRENPMSATCTTGSPTIDLADADVFGRWYEQHWHRAVAYARWIVRDDAAAEDIAADALLRCWERWRVSGAPTHPWAYVTRAMHNLAASRARRSQRDRAYLEGLGPCPDPSPQTAVEDRHLVDELLRRLPSQERTSVVLHYLEDLPGPEVAAHLSVAPATVRSHLLRARRRLAATAAW